MKNVRLSSMLIVAGGLASAVAGAPAVARAQCAASQQTQPAGCKAGACAAKRCAAKPAKAKHHKANRHHGGAPAGCAAASCAPKS